MPELPDLDAYVHALAARVVGQPLRRLRLGSPFVLRTAVPPIAEAEGRTVLRVSRLGKRIVLTLDDGRHLVLHLMVLGRLAWKRKAPKLGGRSALAAFDFDSGSLLFTESGSRHRASLHFLDSSALAASDPGGLEVLAAPFAAFAAALRRESHTLKRALTDPRILAGIGNAYGDEILHRAGLSPLQLTGNLDEAEVRRLHEATVATLTEARDRIRAEVGEGFPEKVTAFRPEFAVHGRYGLPCPVCGTSVQRIRYAENEANYCPRCQTGGKLLADRSLSRLLRDDWPRSIDEWEERVPGGVVAGGEGAPGGRRRPRS